MRKQLLLVVLISFVLYRVFELAVWLGLFMHTFEHAPGPCHSLPGMDFGSEDIQVLPNGLAFISSGLRLQGMGKKEAVGKIYQFDFNKPNDAAKELKIVAEPKYRSLNPHGISYWNDTETGTIYLYVINHLDSGESVDKYKFEPSTSSLRHMRRIENEANFHILNNLVVVDEDKFYVTNSQYVHRYPLLETVLRFHWGSIAYYDGHSARIIVDGLLMPNGIASFGRNVYVANIGDLELTVYERHENDSLSFIRSTKLWTAPDNINVDPETGEIWIGAHPQLYKASEYLTNPEENISPSQVLKIKVSDGQSKITEVYSNDGTEISGSTVAARYKDAILVGTVFTNTLYCELKI
jgi:arylesterase/paraoxonase